MQRLSTRILSFLMAIIMMLSLTTSVFATAPTDPAESNNQTEVSDQTGDESAPSEESPVEPAAEMNPLPDDTDKPSPQPEVPSETPVEAPTETQNTQNTQDTQNTPAASQPDPVPVTEGEITVPVQELPRLTALYEGHRVRYYDSAKQPLPEHASLHMGQIDEEDIPFYLQRAAHALGLESCGMYLYFIADPILEDASTAEVLHYNANPDDPDDRMTVEVTLIDDADMTDEEKAQRLNYLHEIHIEDLQVILLGSTWGEDTLTPFTYDEETGVIRFTVETVGGFILLIPDWDSAVYPEEDEVVVDGTEIPTNPEVAEPLNPDAGTENSSNSTEDAGTQQLPEQPVTENPTETTAADADVTSTPEASPSPEVSPSPDVPAVSGEQTVTASGADYSVSLTYSADANIPEGAVFELSELPGSGILYDNLTTSVASTLNAETEEISSVTFVDVDVKKDGDSVPLDAPVNVSIAVDDPADGDMVTQVVALGQQNEVLNPDEGTAGTFSSTTDSLTSTYAIVRITKQATLKTSDDQTYLITVTYDRDDSAIPADVELFVKELKEGDPGYDEYIAAGAAVTGADRENLAFARAFDIALVDPATKLECQPTKEVSVSVQLLEEEVNENTQIDVVHFGEPDSPEKVDCALNEENNAIEFAAPGFSVYLIMGYTVDFHWGEYTYSIAGESEIALSALLDKLGVTEITLNDVEGVAFSRPEYVEIEQTEGDWLLKSLAPFDTEEALTLMIKNGQSVQIVVTDEGGSTDPAITVPPTAKEGLVYNGKEQALVDEGTVDEGGTLLYALGENGETPPVDIEGEAPKWSESIPTATDAGTYYVWYKVGAEGEAQCLTVIIQPATFAPQVTMSAGNYDTGSNTITYTVTVAATGDLNAGYPVMITNDQSGLSFQSGSYTYVHKEGFNRPEDAPESQVNDVDISSGSESSFNGFPITVSHMYDGDILTLTYTARVDRAVYDASQDSAKVDNTVSIALDDSAARNITNDTENDTAKVTTEGIPCTPLTREYLTLDGSWAYWKVTVNPDGYTLNNGSPLTLADTFDDDYPTKETKTDAGQSIDYASVVVSDDSVTYDYSGNTGTFVIPDNTPVIITYRTRITAQPGEAETFRGTAVLKTGTSGDEIARATAGVTGDPVVIYPSPSDVTGNDYMVKLYVYAEKAMQTGIEGATFILLDANQRPLEYKKGDNEGNPVTFVTGSDGYVNIELHEEAGDVSIEKNTGYYLEMMQAVEGYQKDNTLYSFMITDDPSYSSGGFYSYYNGDTMKVRLYPKSAGLSVSIRFSGSYSLTEEQQNNITAVLQKQEGENNWVEVERHPYTDTKYGSITFNEKLYNPELGEYQNVYRVVEENQHPWDLPDNIIVGTTYYCLINTNPSDPYSDPNDINYPFVVTKMDDSVSVVIDNRYEEPQLTLIKMDKQTGNTLASAEFSVYEIVNGHVSGDPVKTYTTEADGEVVIRGGDPFESETLYGIKETKAPENYLLPLNDEWHYFYFCNDEYLEPSILANLPEGATAVNLTNNGDRITVGNQKETITVPVMKLWQGAAWPNNDEVLIGLYQSVAGSDPVPVLNEDGTPRQVTLNKGMPYNNTAFTTLPSRDSQDRNIVYSIKEESINGLDPLAAGYNQECGVSSAGVYIVRNKPATSLTVSKEWYDKEGNRITDEATLRAQSPVTFDVYRTTVPYKNTDPETDPEKDITNAEMTSFVSGLDLVRAKVRFGIEDEWSKTINDLDYQDDLGNRYYYYVLEYIPSFGNELYDVNKASGTITIKNIIAPNTVNLTVTKAPLKDDPRAESLDRDFTFTLKLQKDDTHPVRSWQVYTDTEHPENNLVTDRNGEAVFSLKPTDPDHQSTEGASITLSLPAGVNATVTETYNPEYTVATEATVEGTTGDNGRSFTYGTSTDADAVTLTYTNTLHVICKIITDDGTQIPFESIKSALARLRTPGTGEAFTSPWTIYMLEDYTIPVTDVVDVQNGESLTLTTASTTDELFPFRPPVDEPDRSFAIITRGGVGDSMLKNAGTLTLENVCLNGAKDSFTATGNGGLIYSSGILNLNNKTTLRNSATDGRGGAVYATGTVNIADGVEITGNSAPSASALFLNGTLNMSGGSITGNTGAADGAVVAENATDVVNLSGSPVIFDNTNNQGAQGKAANLFIGVDSDNAVNVVVPGLTETAHIGVTAMEGHMLIGEQFATAEYEQTANLNCFVNDTYGYRGKLKDGTSTNIVWDGLKITIKKVVDPIGANPNDRFTITLASPSIIMGTYIIDGTLDYTITAARQGRPGTIVLRNVKADDEISISPLPVGNYTITEEAPNYSQTYTINGTESGQTESKTISDDFYADSNSTVTVTNTRKLADVNLTKTLEDQLIGEAAVEFTFTVMLIEADGTPVIYFPLKTDEGTPDPAFITDAQGKVIFPMSPTDAGDVIENFQAPVGATMTITETIDPNYRITASAKTMPEEGEVIPDLDEDYGNVFKFQVTTDGANVTFANVRKMAEIELSKTLDGKVSLTESYTFKLTLKNQDDSAVANYMVYRDEKNPENNIRTNASGVAEVPFTFGNDETEPKSIPLTIPDGTKLTVEETNLNGHADFYNTTYSRNGAAAQSGTKVEINSVSETDKSIAFTNTRKTNTIVVKNKVNGYSGNVVPFTYTATVTDGGENAYNDNGFEDGVMTFELITDQTQPLTVPFGATLSVAETFIVGYSTTVKRGSAGAVENLSDTFSVTTDMPDSSPLLFTNSQLIGLRIVNNTTSTLENVTITVDKNNIYRVNDDQTGQERISTTKNAVISVEAGKTAILEIQHDTSTTAEQNYSVMGITPTEGYYYTIHNEPSFHETANPAVLRVYDAANYEVKGKLRYSVKDSTVTFTEQPLVSFDSNGGTWTTEMDGYRDRNGNRKVYQKAVDSGKTVVRPTPDPVYPTAENIPLLGWTDDETFAKKSHTAGEDISAKEYKFDTTVVTAPVTLYAVWAKPARDTRVVTVKNGHNEELAVTVTLSQKDTQTGDYTPTSGYEITDSLTTNENGQASFTLPAGESKNLKAPDGAKLVLSLERNSLAVSSEFKLTASDDNKNFTIKNVDRDGTVTFILGICKITDSTGNVLYDASGNPAVYQTLAAAFTAYAGTLYTDASHTTTATQTAVKMLVDEYEISSNHTFPNKNMTLTTAGKDDKDGFPFFGLRNRSALYRDSFTTDSLFAHTNASEITLTDIILDGGSENGVKIAKTKNGGLINMSNALGVLNVTTGTTMRNCEFAAYDNADNSRGGAIYAKNGTINVSAGLFSNLHARHGGAICAEDKAVLIVTGNEGSTVFENCSTNSSSDNNLGGDGGAIFYNNKNASTDSTSYHLVINGGDDKKNPGIIFTGCIAGSNWGDGGAIYANTNNNNEVTITGCSFTECSARNTTGKNDDGYGGGGIGAQFVSYLTVSHCSFSSCDSLKGGGAVLARVKKNTTAEEKNTVSISDCSFLNCSCKAQGGAVAAYANENSGSSTRTKLYVENCEFSNCSSGTDNGSGGAIQCFLPLMQFIGSTFTDCWAGKEGGAVNNYYGNNYTEVWQYSSMTVSDCSFIRCRAEDRYEPTALQHYGGGINTKVKTVTVTDSYFEDCVSTLREGGALHIGGQGSESKATITGSTFKNCSAKNGGGALLSSHETLEIENCNFYGCSSSASNGGAVYHYRNSRGDSTQKNLTITGCTFSTDPDDANSLGCSAAQNGGAIWTRATTDVLLVNLAIGHCTASNGGGIYLNSTTTTVKIIDGSITKCKATNGSAVYVGKSAIFSGGLSVTENIVSSINDGAIHGGTLYFGGTTYKKKSVDGAEETVTVGGNVRVFDNTCSADSTYKHDVLMQNNNVTTIYTTDNGLGSEANIGVYVPDSVFNNRGLEGKAFGTYNYKITTSSNYLESFFNNRDSELYGYQLAADDSNIYWGSFVCKITDASGKTLTRPNGRDAVYPRLSQALDEFTQVTGGEAVYVKMLVEKYAVRQSGQIENIPAANVTLTTETYTGDDPVPGKYDGKHPYRGTDGTVCTISRTSGTTQLFKLSNAKATFELENITLDGRNDKSTQTGNRRLIEATAGSLIINGGTTMQYGAASNGGAIEAAAGAKVTINGEYDDSSKGPTVKFINCTVTGNKPNGGAIRAYDLNIYNSTEETGKYGTAFINCNAYNGGAITSLGSAMEIKGVLFDSCHTQSAGGAVYHNNSTEGTSTIVKNCAFEKCLTNGNTWAHGGAIEARTGTLSVEDCAFKDCSATSDGGAVYHGLVDDKNKPSGNRVITTIINTTFDDCSTSGTDNAYNYGGSVYTQAKTVEIQGCSFTDSTAYNHGGALYCQTNVEDSAATISGTSFENCSTTRTDGYGGAIYSRNKALTLKKNGSKVTSIAACTAPGFSGAIHMETSGSVRSVLTITDGTVISGCYANKGGAIYLQNGVTMNLTGSPEFTQNGYATINGSIVNATDGACIYLEQGSRINLKDSPKFSRNILPNEPRITNAGVTDFVRQDIYMAGYASTTAFDTNAASIYVVGELTGDTIWVWPEQSPHRLANEQFAKIPDGVTVSPDSLSVLRNALADSVTHCEYGEHLAGVQINEENKNVYWDKMYAISFKKIDNKGVHVPGAEFTLYKDLGCEEFLAKAVSKDDNKGTVEFTSIRIGAYYMKETGVPKSFKDNDTTYLVLVGTPYLSPNADNRSLWEGDGPLNVTEAAILVARHTTDAGKYYGIFPLDKNNKAVLRANLASNNVGIENIRNDYQAAFMKVDSSGNALPGAAFTIYTQMLDSEGQPESFDDGYPKLMLWTRDGETYPPPVVSADGTAAFKDKDNKPLPKGMVYFRELPLGTYYLLETAYPERNGDGRRTYYLESDRVFKLELEEDEDNPGTAVVILSEWISGKTDEGESIYQPLKTTKVGDKDYYYVDNREVVCKLTDRNDNLLNTQGHMVWENPETSSFRLFPAIYETLEDGFDAAQQGTFVYADGSDASVDILKLKVLKDFTLSGQKPPIVYKNSDRDITFTTSETRASKDRYVFSTTRTADPSRAHITRAYSEGTSQNANAGALLTVTDGANMSMQNIRLNGQKGSQNGRAVYVTGGSSLTIGTSTQIDGFRQTAITDSLDANSVRGGAILLDDNTSLTVNGGTNRSAVFSNNEVLNNRSGTVGENGMGADGGAIAVGENCSFILKNAQFTGNKAIASTGENGNGGAISIPDNPNQKEFEFENVVFTSNTASYKGGAVYVGSGYKISLSNNTIRSNVAVYGSAVYIQDNVELTVSNGTISGNRASAETGGAINAETNSVIDPETDGEVNPGTDGETGGAEDTIRYKYYFIGSPVIYNNYGQTGTTQQKNVVLSEDTNGVINTTGSGLKTNAKIGVYVIDGKDGGIYQKHGITRMPFGTFVDAGTNTLSLASFRNDRHTDLYGVKNEDDAGDYNIYWSGTLGSRKVILRKVLSGTYAPKKNETFMVYTNQDMTIIAKDKDNQPICAEGNPLRSLDSGVFYIGELPYGTYYIKETSTNPYRNFIITVNEYGIGYSEDGKSFTREVNAS